MSKLWRFETREQSNQESFSGFSPAENISYNALWLLSEHIQRASTWSCQHTLPQLSGCWNVERAGQESSSLRLWVYSQFQSAAEFPAGCSQPCQGELGSCTASPGASSRGSCPVQSSSGILREGFTSQPWHSPSSWTLFLLLWSDLIHNLQFVP